MTLNRGGYIYNRLTSDSTNICRKSTTISSIIIKRYSFSNSVICTRIINLKSIYRSSSDRINYSTLNRISFGSETKSLVANLSPQHKEEYFFVNRRIEIKRLINILSYWNRRIRLPIKNGNLLFLPSLVIVA